MPLMYSRDSQHVRPGAEPGPGQPLAAARALLCSRAPPSRSDLERALNDCAARVLAVEAEALRHEQLLDELLAAPADARPRAGEVHARLRRLDAERGDLRAVLRDLRAQA